MLIVSRSRLELARVKGHESTVTRHALRPDISCAMLHRELRDATTTTVATLIDSLCKTVWYSQYEGIKYIMCTDVRCDPFARLRAAAPLRVNQS